MSTEQWKVEVSEAEIDENFDSESKARTRFEELVRERYDHEIVKLYRIGSNGTQISDRTERGHRKITDGRIGEVCIDCEALFPSREHISKLVPYGDPVREKQPVGERGHWLEVTRSHKCPNAERSGKISLRAVPEGTEISRAGLIRRVPGESQPPARTGRET